MADARLMEQILCYSEAGYSLFKLNGKIPALKGVDWSKTEYLFPDDASEFFAGWQGNFGVVLTARDLVIDVDPRNFKEGDKPHVRLFQDSGIDIKTCAAVARTGGGGLHIYLRLPEGTKIRKKNPLYPGIDFLSAGHYVVGAGSVHPDTRKNYEWASGVGLSEIQQAPPALLGLISTSGGDVALRENHQPADIHEGISDGDLDTIQKYTEYLSEAPVAVQGENGDQTTFAVACKGRDLGLSRALTLSLLLKHYNHRCRPDWKPEELAVKVRNAFQYAAGRVGGDLATVEFDKIEIAGKHELFRGWDRMVTGKLAKTLNNAFNFFITTDSPIRDTIAYDEFNGQVKILKKLPWSKENIHPGGQEWTDGDSVQLALWLSREREFDVKITTVDQAVLAAAQLTILHPVKDFLRSLSWDGKPRLETWLRDYAGADDNRFVREASKKFLLQAVSRVYNPGCKADHIVVLEGEQGVGKSSIVEILGGVWYGDIVIDPHSRDTVDAMRGKWFIEFSEMEAHNRSDAQAMKAFITRRVDRVRLAYGRRSVDLPRQCVFMGTMNPDATGEYLSDSTGNRRIWPILVRKVNFKGLEEVRGQLFAEAADLVLKGHATHIIDEEVIGLAVAAQRARQTTDPWELVISEYLAEQKVSFISTKDVWVYALKGSESVLNIGHQRRIAGCLKDLGYIALVRRDPATNAVVRGFIRKDEKELNEMLN